MDNENRKLTSLQKWEQATISNNFIFYKIMRNNPNECKRLLEILLDIKIEKMEYNQEETIDIDFGAKGIRLDLFIQGDSRSYDIEVQTVDTKDLPKRARYYQGVMDIDFLKSGEKYSNLNENYVIFICLDDIFKQGLPVYTFENICIENKNIRLGDQTCKIFFNAKDCDKIEGNEKKSFMRLFRGENADSDYARKLKSLVEDAKHNTQWRMQFMTWDRQRAYDYDDGKEAGKNDKALEDAENLLKMNLLTHQQIANAIGLPLETVEEIAEKLMRN